MKKTILFIGLMLTLNQVFSQKLLWTSEFGGQNSNGAIIQYDLSTNQISTPLSLEGNPMYGFNIWREVNTSNGVDYNGGLTLGTDGNYYGINCYGAGPFVQGVIGKEPFGRGFFYRYIKSTGKIEVLHSFVGKQEYNSDQLIPSAAFGNDVSFPVYSVLETSPGVFYGLATEGGVSGYGGVWKYDVNTNTYSVIVSFRDPNNDLGRYPVCNLIKGDGNYIYGLNKNRNGDEGYLYKINTTNNQATFVTALNASGWVIKHPHGQMVYNAPNNTIYGTKDLFDQSTNWGGGVWSYNIDTSTQTNEWTILFSQINSLGSNAAGIIEAPDGFMYVTTRNGGLNNTGSIIKYAPSGNTHVKVFDFPANFPRSSGIGMQISGSRIIGTSDFSTNQTLIWSYDVFSNTFQSMVTGSDTNPNHPGYNIEYGILIDNGNVIGRTRNGSLNGAGSIFSYNIFNGQSTILLDCSSRNGRYIIGDLTQLTNSTFLGRIAKGGPVYNNGSATALNEMGGLAIFNILTGSVTYIDSVFNGVTFNDLNQSQLSYKPLLASNGKLYYSRLIARPSIAEFAVWSNDFNTSTNLLLYNGFSEITTTPGLLEIPGGKIIQAHHDKVNVLNNFGTSVNTYTTHDPLQYGFMDHNQIFASNGKIYGLTTASQSSTLPGYNRAVLYSLDVVNYNFTVEHVFDSLVRTTNGRLTEYNGKLYGSTNFLGANNEGFLFSYDMVNGTFTNEHSFSRATDGAGFNAGWTLFNNKLYSTSRTAGQYGYGTLVEYNLTNSTFATLKHLTMATGRPFVGTPIIWDEMFLGVNENDTKVSAISVYPNPAETNLFIDDEDVELVKVYSLTGQLVIETRNTNEINVEQLKPSVYIISVQNKQGIYYSKFIKN